METAPQNRKFAPHARWTYLARPLWLLVQETFWRIAWKRFPILRATLLRMFGAKVSRSTVIANRVKIHFPWAFSCGNDCLIGPGVNIYNLGALTIGNRVMISQDAYLCGGSHDYTESTYPLITKPIVIEDDVWICAGAFILPGVVIGKGAVVGARAVVSRDVEPWAVVAGNPATRVSTRILRA